MKLKYFIRGLGVGIIFTAIILLLANTSSQNQTGMSEKEIISRAKELGMVTSEENEMDKSLDKLEKATDKPKETVVPNRPKETEKTKEPQVTNRPTKKPTSKPTNESTEKPKKTEKPNTNEKVTLVISSGMLSEKVSEQAQNLGLVESAKEFNLFLYNNGYADRIRVGTFEIPAGATYAEIAQIIAK